MGISTLDVSVEKHKEYGKGVEHNGKVTQQYLSDTRKE
jgi:hypothetical protein